MRVPLPWLGEYVDLLEGATAEQVAADLVRVGLEEEGLLGSDVTASLTGGTLDEDLIPEDTP